MIKLTQKQTLSYKQRWNKIEALQLQELRDTPISLKFRQLCSLMDSLDFTQEDKKREREARSVRQRWLRLKKDWNG